MDWLGAGRSKEEAVEQIHGLIDQLVQEQDRVVRDLKQENKCLRQQITCSRHQTISLTATAPAPQGLDVAAAPVRDSSRQHSLLSTTLPIPSTGISHVVSDGELSGKSRASEKSISVLGIEIVTTRSPPGLIEDQSPVRVFDGEGRVHAPTRTVVRREPLPSKTSPTASPPYLRRPSPSQTASYPLHSLRRPSPAGSWVSGCSSATAFAKRRGDPGGASCSQASLETTKPGLLSHATQDAIRKLAGVTDESLDRHRRAQRFEQDLETSNMGILGLMFKHRLSIDANDIQNTSPLRAKVLKLLSWWVFDAVIGFLIVANAITIGIETSLAANGYGVPIGIEIMESLFLTVFFTELCMRFFAVGGRVFLSHWVKFDIVLVLCGFFDVLVKVTGSNSVLDQLMLVRMFRLIRLGRAARLVVQFRTLWLLVQGLLLSCLPMFYTFCILCSLVYVFAVFGMEIMPVTSEYGPEYEAVVTENFTSIGNAMLVLMQFIFLDSIGPVLHPLVKCRPELCVYFFSFILLGSISLMNLVTAIMVESSLRQASEDQEARKAWEAMKRRQLGPKLRSMFNALDTDSSGSITLDEIATSPSNLQQQLLHMCNMDDMQETFEMLDYDNSGVVDLDEFINGVMRVQADKPAELIRLVKQCSDILKKVASLERRISEPDGKYRKESVRSNRPSLQSVRRSSLVSWAK